MATGQLADTVVASPLRRLWDSPMWAHVVALAVVLVGIWLYVGPGLVTVDEGLARGQAQRLADSGIWVEPGTFFGDDPAAIDGAANPWVLTHDGERGQALYAKLPAYPLILRASLLLGDNGPVWVSLAGLLAAAVVASRVAFWLDRGLARPALWVTALATPLLFNGYVVWAHTLGAVAFGAAALALRRVFAGEVIGVVGVGLAIFLGAQVRQELIVVGLCAGAALIAYGAWRRFPYVVAGGLASIGAAAAGYVTTRLWSRSLVGPTVPTRASGASTEASTSIVDGRIAGFRASMLEVPGSVSFGLLLFGAFVSFAVAGYVARRRGGDAALVPVAVGAGLVALTIALGPSLNADGFLVAFPSVGFALGAATWSGIPEGWARASVLGVGAGFVGVLATQYDVAGGYEWGGRYFAWSLPVVAPLLVWFIAKYVKGSARAAWVIALLMVPALMLNVVGLRSIRTLHRASTELSSAVSSARESSDTPIVFTNMQHGRFVYEETDRGETVFIEEPEGVPAVIGTVSAHDVDEIVVVGFRDTPAFEELLDAGSVLETRTVFGRLDVVRLELPEI